VLARKSKAKSKPTPAPPRRGGTRPGAGRPKKDAQQDDFRELLTEFVAIIGAPPSPEEPLLLAEWVQKAWSLGAYRAMRGIINERQDEALRAWLKGATAAIPAHIVRKAARVVRGGATAAKKPSRGMEPVPADPNVTPLQG
jgi:hypothetical protein